MKKQLNIKEIIERKFTLESGQDILAAAEKYFIYCSEIPTKEDVVWFIKRTKSLIFDRTLTEIMNKGYLNVEDIVENDLLDVLYSNYFLSNLIAKHKNPLPTTQENFDKMFNRLNNSNKKANLAKVLLTVNVSVYEIDNYRSFIDKFFSNLMEILKAGKEPYFSAYDFVWIEMKYIPSSFLIEELKKGLLSEGAFTKATFNLKDYFEKCFIPEQVIEDILPFYASTPYAGSHFPYTSGMGMEFILNNLEKMMRTSQFKMNKELKRKAYNLFIKPYLNNPGPFVDFFKRVEKLVESASFSNNPYRYYSDNFAIRAITGVAACVTPPADDANVVNLLTKIKTRWFGARNIVDAYGSMKKRKRLLVSEDFIKIQFDHGMNQSYMCFNNPCICSLSFWLKLRNKIDLDIISNELVYNNSFQESFIPKVEEISLYEENTQHIGWKAMSSIKTMPVEFLRHFKGKLVRNFLSTSIIKDLSEQDLIDIYTDEKTKKVKNLPGNLLYINNNLSGEFVAKNLTEIYSSCGYNDRYGSKASHIKLSEVVGALV